MALPRSVQSLVPLVIGLAVGIVGTSLFRESLPGSAGSPEERAAKLEVELQRAQNRLAALDAGGTARGAAGTSTDGLRGLGDGARKIAEDLHAGRPVSPEDIFRASQPLMRDLAPLFDRMRLRQQQQAIDSMTGELARKYDLTPANQQLLKQWFERKAEREAERWSAMLAHDGTRLEDLIRASRDVRPDEGIETIMPSILSIGQLASFNAERSAERTQRVEREADMKVQRLDSIVRLDEAQRDQVFGIMARSSREYDRTMVVEGAQGEIAATPPGDRQAAMLAVLRPDQRAAYDAERERRRVAAAKDMEAVGLVLPPGWEMLDE